MVHEDSVDSSHSSQMRLIISNDRESHFMFFSRQVNSPIRVNLVIKFTVIKFCKVGWGYQHKFFKFVLFFV